MLQRFDPFIAGSLNHKQSVHRTVQDLGFSQLDTAWCLPSWVDQHPLAWIIQVDGIAVDARALPIEIQEIAFEKGIIPYVPDADRPAG